MTCPICGGTGEICNICGESPDACQCDPSDVEDYVAEYEEQWGPCETCGEVEDAKAE